MEKAVMEDSFVNGADTSRDKPEHPERGPTWVVRSRAHLEEADMGYWPHLTHAFHQSNRLVVVAVKSYIHGLFPLWYKSDGPKTIIRIYHEIRRIRHLDSMARDYEKGLKDRDQLASTDH